MSRLSEKIQVLRSQISDLEGDLEAAEDKLRRQNFKRRRKAFRKKMRKDPMYRLMARMEKQMFGSLILDSEGIKHQKLLIAPLSQII